MAPGGSGSCGGRDRGAGGRAGAVAVLGAVVEPPGPGAARAALDADRELSAGRAQQVKSG